MKKRYIELLLECIDIINAAYPSYDKYTFVKTPDATLTLMGDCRLQYSTKLLNLDILPDYYICERIILVADFLQQNQ